MFRRVLPCLLLASASPALGQLIDIETEEGKPWTHQWTSFTAPPVLEGSVRSRVTSLNEEQTNFWVTYQDRETGTTTTIFLYRSGLMSVLIWFDRALEGMKNSSGVIGALDTSLAQSGSFTPISGGGEGSGLLLYGPTTGGGMDSTGLALFPFDDWLVKIRISSRDLAPPELFYKFVDVLSNLRLPQSRIEYPAASDIAPCETQLNASDAGNRSAASKDAFGAIASIAAGKRKPPQGAMQRVEDPEYCREWQEDSSYSVYRSKGSRDSYVLALGDSGYAVSVGKYDLSWLGPRQADLASRYWAMAMEEGRTGIFVPFSALPDPDYLLDTVMEERPSAAVVFEPNGNTRIVLPPD